MFPFGDDVRPYKNHEDNVRPYDFTHLDSLPFLGYSPMTYSHTFSVLLLHVPSTARSPQHPHSEEKDFCEL